MKKIRFAGILIVLLFLRFALVFPYNDVIKGDMASHINGNDKIGLYINDVGGGIAYMYIKSFFYPSYEQDPMYQSVENFSFQYSQPIAFSVDSIDVYHNSYRYSYWGDTNATQPQLSPGEYTLTNKFDAYLYVTLDGLADTTKFPITTYFPPRYSKVSTANFNDTIRQCCNQEFCNIPYRWMY